MSLTVVHIYSTYTRLRILPNSVCAPSWIIYSNKCVFHSIFVLVLLFSSSSSSSFHLLLVVKNVTLWWAPVLLETIYIIYMLSLSSLWCTRSSLININNDFIKFVYIIKRVVLIIASIDWNSIAMPLYHNNIHIWVVSANVIKYLLYYYVFTVEFTQARPEHIEWIIACVRPSVRVCSCVCVCVCPKYFIQF